MTSAELLVDAFGRIREVVHRVIDGLSPEQLAFRVDPEANSIAWLVWHLTRIQDDHLADAFFREIRSISGPGMLSDKDANAYTPRARFLQTLYLTHSYVG